MSVLKCKMCGGNLTVETDMTVCECEYCGTKQTIPVMNDEKKMKLYERANKLRFNCDFDKAATVYESIADEFSDEAEAYWGIILCTYGIEYVDDPATGKKIPTCHRSSFDSVMEDDNFEMVMENADSISRAVYREEAKTIEEIRKGILEVSGKEDPYDIFICYKETDENGDRTVDSVIAQEVYDALTEKGYRVFFSRISLEDKLGTEYEPYIFAALNSAKVMLAFGTSYENYNAVWVKNEWSRFLKLMSKDKEKRLIPCYKDIDAYDMPKEFKHLQAQDMGKVGAVQDLLRGIEKIASVSIDKGDGQKEQVATAYNTLSGPNLDSMLKRGFMCLEDGSFDEAKSYFDRALDMDAESGKAYMGLFMTDIQAKNEDAVKTRILEKDQSDNRHYIRMKQFADTALLAFINGCEKERKKAEEEEKNKVLQLQTKIQEKIHVLQKRIESGKLELSEEDRQEEQRLFTLAEEAESAYKTLATDYEKMNELEEVERLKNEIASKQRELGGLGMFKGKLKKELMQQISDLNDLLKKCESTLQLRRDAMEKAKKDAEAAKNKAADYKKNRCEQETRVITQKVGILQAYIENKDEISYGYYKQDRNKEELPIKWKVLSKDEEKMFLISEKGLDCKPYSERGKNATWEYSSLRRWLNETFLNDAFYKEQQLYISETVITNEDNKKYSTSGGGDTKDRIFLLSIAEAEAYFLDDEARKCAPTQYSISHGAEVRNIASEKTKDGEATGWWWLRTPGGSSENTAFVHPNGSIFPAGSVSYDGNRSARPAFYLDLKALIE